MTEGARAPAAGDALLAEKAVTPPENAGQIAPRALIVMGVSGSGKSTLGLLLAGVLRCRFLEGDAFHSLENVAKMRAGEPLDDQDRWPWLDRLGAELSAAVARDGAGVAACSALKRSYRERLERIVQAPLAFVFLDARVDDLARRLHDRVGHYMPASLLASQLQALEAPGPDEAVLALDAGLPPQALCEAACAWLARTATGP